MDKVYINYAAIGRRIKERRKELGLNQRELASRVGLSEGSISKYENGKVEDATLHMIAKFADSLGVSIGWLLGLEVSSMLTRREKYLIDGFNALNQSGKDYLLQTLEMAKVSNPKDSETKKDYGAEAM
ncbi:MAG: helix-turn-helix domain-containing protein [Clostridia bacterium]|nr:helix-turn-helix domain-containing protein [Clostridia bacterium]